MASERQQQLEKLSLVALSDLFGDIEAVYLRRLRREAWKGFDVVVSDEGRRAGVRVRITDAGPKNLTGYEIDEDGRHLRHRKWRVSPHLARVVPKADKPSGTGVEVNGQLVGAF